MSTELGERLHTIRAHLRTGALGQREVWEEWLTEAAEAILSPAPDQEIKHLADQCATLLRENERLRAALQEIANMGTGERVRIARRALEPKP